MPDLNVFAGNSFFYPIKNSTYLCFKTLEKGDREKIIDGFKKLSPRSVYHRFFGFLKELSEKQIAELLDTDSKNHIAWSAFDIKGEELIGVGVGRFRRLKTAGNEAELALTVIDEYQNQGVGTILLAVLYYLASQTNIEWFTGIIMSDNTQLIRRFKDLGADMRRIGSEYEMRLPVYKNFNDIPNTKYSRIVKPVLYFLTENNFCA